MGTIPISIKWKQRHKFINLPLERELYVYKGYPHTLLNPIHELIRQGQVCCWFWLEPEMGIVLTLSAKCWKSLLGVKTERRQHP